MKISARVHRQVPLPRTKFLLELIKPSHYDDDGYVIQWWRGFVPSNSLSSIYGLAHDARDRHVLGAQVDIEIEAHDETNTKVPLRSIVRRFARNANRGLVLIIGVQTNQFARAVDIATELLAAGIKVAIGGFHVSGCIAMLPEMPPEMKDAIARGITLFAGEAENRLDDLFAAAFEDRLESLYNFMTDLPAMEGTPLPFLPMRYVKRYAGALGCFDAGRGCPFSCSFCTIINVQGRKSRHRSADDIEQLIRTHSAQGVKSFFITDDNFARNKNWESILDRSIELKRRDRLKINIIMQVDTMCHKIHERDQALQNLRDTLTEVNARVERAGGDLRPDHLVESHPVAASLVSGALGFLIGSIVDSRGIGPIMIAAVAGLALSMRASREAGEHNGGERYSTE